MNPRVTFIVPCYKLAHLLPECINSMLMQTYQDFEILIMDDCSPDDTAEVAQSFIDPRVKHVRNEPNLGHLRNYNKGIEMAKGQYVWLISADDRLRKPYALERYVRLMDEHPNVGFAFCPAIHIEDGQETNMADYSYHGDRDRIFKGRDFLAHLANGNFVPAATGMVRRECYEKVNVFPLDLPDAGDWYLWCVFALHFDVAYFAEPMASYRLHPQSMTNQMSSREHLVDQVAVRWRIKRLAQQEHCASLADRWLRSCGSFYARCVLSGKFDCGELPLTFSEFEESLRQNTAGAREVKIVRAQFYEALGDHHYAHGEFSEALRHYLRALKFRLWAPKVWVKIILLRLGKLGVFLRNRTGVSKPASAVGKSEFDVDCTTTPHAGRKQA